MSASAAATPGFPAIHTGYLTRLDASDQPVDETCLQQANANHMAESQFLGSTFFLALRNRQLPASGKASAMAMLAHAMAAGDTYRSVYDPNNGKLQYLYITHADGSKTNWTFDTENQYTWSSAVVDYNPAGQVTDATWNNKDGTYVYQVFDLAHGDVPEWITQAGFADGHWIVWTHDTAGTQQWWQTENVWGAGGVALSETVYWRNGNTEVLAWDPAHGDALQSDTLNTPTGAHQTVWDTAGTQSWSSYTADFNSSGVLLDQTFTDRDGSFTAYTWNPTISGDPLTSQTAGTPSDGVSATIWYDTAGAAWNTETTMIDPEGRMLGANWLYNNGTDHYESLAAREGWALKGEKYLNTSISQWTTANPGASFLGGEMYTFADGAGDREVQIYNVGGHLTSVYDHFADGSSDIMVGTPGPNPNEPFDTLTAMFNHQGTITAMIENTSENGVSNIVVVTAAEISQSLLNPGSSLTFISHDVQLVLDSENLSNGYTESQIYWKSLSGGAQTAIANGSAQETDHFLGAVIGATLGGLSGAGVGYVTGAALAAAVANPIAAAAVIGVSIAGAAVAGVGGGYDGGGVIGSAVGYAADHGYSYNPGYSEPDFDPNGTNDPGWTGGGDGSNATPVWNSDFIAGHAT